MAEDSALADGFIKLLQLSTLSVGLGHNRIGSEGCINLAIGFSKLWQLSNLSSELECNQVRAEGCRALADGFNELLQLSTLSVGLGHNRIGSEGCINLAKIGFSKQLSDLSVDLGYNELGAEELDALRRKLQHVSKVKIKMEAMARHGEVRIFKKGTSEVPH